MGDDHHRRTAFGKLAHHGKHLKAEFRIERVGRLVEQHEPRLQSEGAGDGDALLVAARAAGRVLACLVGKAYARQKLHGNRLRLLPAPSHGALLREADVAQDGEMGKQVEGLEHHGDGAAERH